MNAYVAIVLSTMVLGVIGQSEFAGYIPPPVDEKDRPAGPVILSEVGNVYSFGDGSTGQLGLGVTSLSRTPRIVDSLPRGKVYMAAAGYAHAVAVTETGAIYTWGNNAFGQLGFRNVSVDFTLPTLVADLADKRIVYVCAGFGHTVAVTDKGVAMAWGSNDHGQLGLEGFTATFTPTVITGLLGKKITRVSCGFSTTYAVTDKGLVYAFGDNSLGQLGQGHTNTLSGVNQVDWLMSNNIIQVEAGWTHAIAVDEAGNAHAWGDNSVGQLGLGHKQSPITRPTVIPALKDKGVFFVAVGYFHNFVLTDSGLVFAFGSNDHGQLGVYDKFDRDLPVIVPLLSMRNVTQISAGATHSIVATGNNRVYTFGSNSQGQLGTSTFQDRIRPTAVEMDVTRVYEVLAGYQFSLILAESCTELPSEFPGEHPLGDIPIRAPPQMLRG